MQQKNWAQEQAQHYRQRRRFIREILLQRLAFNLVVKPILHHPERLPQSGATIMLINHVTAIDPILLAGVVRSRDVVIMSKAENFQHPVVGLLARAWGCFPVRRGEIDREALRISTELLEQGALVLIAPEGTRSPHLIEPKEGAAYLAAKTNALVVPTAVYHAEQWMKGFVVPWRIPVHVAFGQPFRLRSAGRTRVPRQELRAMMEQMMYQLAALLPASYRGIYADLSQMQSNHLEFV